MQTTSFWIRTPIAVSISSDDNRLTTRANKYKIVCKWYYGVNWWVIVLWKKKSTCLMNDHLKFSIIRNEQSSIWVRSSNLWRRLTGWCRPCKAEVSFGCSLNQTLQISLITTSQRYFQNISCIREIGVLSKIELYLKLK